jgi:hypothetical protein
MRRQVGYKILNVHQSVTDIVCDVVIESRELKCLTVGKLGDSVAENRKWIGSQCWP